MERKPMFIIEKTGTGFSAYAENDNLPVTTSADTIEELMSNILDAYNSFADLKGFPELSSEDIKFKIDLPQFFEYYKVINASALGARIGMDKTLLSQYVNGHKSPGEKQIQRIMEGIRQLGNELASLKLA